jgi:nucleoside-diphosphate-sugar epimerase
VPELAGQRVLVTGAAGFIGSHLTHELVARGTHVHALVRPGSELARLAPSLEQIDVLEADLADAAAVTAAVRSAQPQLAVNLAAERGHAGDASARSAQLRVSVLGTANLIDALEDAPLRRLVHGGSALEYAPSDTALREDDPIGPTSFRGTAKAAATIICRSAAHTSGLPVVVLRIFHVYGPGEGDHRLLPTVIRAALRGEEIRLTAGDDRRDFVYVGDVVDAIIAALVTPADVDGEIVNIGSGREATNAELVDAVRSVTGNAVRVAADLFPSRPTDATHRLADIGKAHRLLGWKPAHTLDDGVRATVDWVRERDSAHT